MSKAKLREIRLAKFKEWTLPVEKPRRNVVKELKEWDSHWNKYKRHMLNPKSRHPGKYKTPEEMNFRVSNRKVDELIKTKNTEELQKIKKFLHPIHRENIDEIGKAVKTGRYDPNG